MEIVGPKILPPKFAAELRGSRYVDEGHTAHFHCEVENFHDPNLNIEFYHNGKALQSSARHHKAFVFGHLSLDIQNCVPEDSGEYSVKVINTFGQCTSTVSLTVTSKDSIISKFQHSQGLEIQELELFELQEVPVPVTWQRPVFTQPLLSIYNIQEGQTAHFECRLLPVGDPTLKVEWFKQQKVLLDSWRITKTHDLVWTGCVSMTITHVCDEDEGVYICRASNLFGEYDTTSELKISQRSLKLEPHPIGRKKIKQLEAQRYPAGIEIEEPQISPPKFSIELRGSTNVYEGQTARFRCQVAFVHDHNLSIAFYHNGKALRSSPRHHRGFAFGYVSLDIHHCIPEDAGVYSVKVTNALGQCTSTIHLTVTLIDSIISKSKFQHLQRLGKIREMETVKLFESPKIPVPITKQKPVFMQPLHKIYNFQEGQFANFECKLLPVGDPTLKVEWFRKKKLLRNNFRITKRHDLLRTAGYVSMTIAHVCKVDEGVYMCRASNLFGESVTTGEMIIRSNNIRAGHGQPSLIFKLQYPIGLKRIWQLDKQRSPTRREVVEAKISSPKFVIDVNGTRQVFEGQTAHFRCQVENVRDPNLYIKFYHNGKALNLSPRYNITFQFGYVSLDIQHCVPEDSGEYSIELINALGQCTSTTSMKVIAKGSIISESQSSHGLENIRDLKSAELCAGKQPEIPVPVIGHRPVFTQHLQNIHNIQWDPIHGHIARFECRLDPIEDPTLKVEWYRNNTLIENSWRITKTHDARTGCLSITVTHIHDNDEGVYTCHASNRFGASVTTCIMKRTKRAVELMEARHQEDLKKIHQEEHKQQGKRWNQSVDLRSNKVEAKPENLCLVCGDKASGKHNEVPSCDDCRKFFDESIRQNLGYVCKETGRCDMDVSRRNQCQACRFSKCLSVKMKKDDRGTSSCRLTPGRLK